jgi:hypothetical protein
MEKKGVDLYSQARGLVYSIQEYLILCMQVHLTKQFSFTGNQHFPVLHVAPLYVLYVLAFYPFPPLLPSKPQYLQLVHTSVTSSAEKHFNSISR